MNQTLDPLSTALGVGTDTRASHPEAATASVCDPVQPCPVLAPWQCLQAPGKLGGAGTGTQRGLAVAGPAELR